MRRRSIVGALAVAAAVVPPAPASAQFLATGLTVPFDRVTFLSATSSGSLVVDWEADPATCAGHGRCGTSGTITSRPSGGGAIAVYERRRRVVEAFLFTGGEPGSGVPLSARSRGPAGLCADALAGGLSVDLAPRDGSATVALHSAGAPSSLVETRCAGPLSVDVAPALPTLSVPLGRLKRGGLTLRLAGSGGFAAAGMRGTVTTDVSVRVGRGQSAGGEEISGRGRRTRIVRSSFRVAGVSGDVALDVAGGDDCAALAACGLTGTQVLAPALTRGTANLYSVARAARGRRASRAAIGLAPGGVGPGIQTFGLADWRGDGQIEATVGRPGEPPCTDVVPLRDGLLNLDVGGTRVRASYLPGLSGAVRTRCAGPLLTEQAVAAAELPLRAFGRRRVVLRLTRPRTLLDDGWTARSRSTLTIVLERTRVTEQLVGG